MISLAADNIQTQIDPVDMHPSLSADLQVIMGDGRC
jgi:hypothetical protein